MNTNVAVASPSQDLSTVGIFRTSPVMRQCGLYVQGRVEWSSLRPSVLPMARHATPLVESLASSYLARGVIWSSRFNTWETTYKMGRVTTRAEQLL